jgi:hypothetical protein
MKKYLFIFLLLTVGLLAQADVWQPYSSTAAAKRPKIPEASTYAAIMTGSLLGYGIARRFINKNL